MGRSKPSVMLSLGLMVVTSVVVLTTGASASTPVLVDTESELKSLGQRADVYRAELEQGTGDSGTPALLLSTLKEIRRRLGSQVASTEDASPTGERDVDRERAALDEEMARVAQAWIELQPHEIGGYLARLRLGDSGFDPSVLEQIRERFSDNLPALQSTASDLRRMGQGRAAEDLLRSFLESHPKSLEAYVALIDHYERQKAESKAARLARLWLDRLPGDPKAQRYHFRYNHSELDEQERGILAEAMLHSLATAPDPRTLCDDLEKGRAVQRAAECWLRLEASVKPSAFSYSDRRALIRTVAAAGDAEELLSWMKRLGEGTPGRVRDSWLLSEISSQLVGAGQCDALRSFLIGSELSPDHLAKVENHHERLNLSQSMGRCGLEGAAEATLSLFRNAQPDRLQFMVSPSRLRGVPIDPLEKILLDRLYSDPHNAALQGAVAELYRQTGEPEKLLAHYLDWAAHDPSSGSASLNAAELLAAQGRLEAAKTWIEEFLRRGSDNSSLFHRAVKILHQLGEVEWAQEMAREMSQSDDISIASAGHRQLLKIAREDGRRDDVLAHFRGLEEIGSIFREDRDAYVAEMQAAGRIDEIVAEVEARAREMLAAGSLDGTLEAALGSEFASAGLWRHSVDSYRQAVAMAPDDVDLRIRLAQSSSELERPEETERAYRGILELSPTHSHTLTKLGFLLQKREDFAAVVELLEPIAASGHRLEGSAGVILGHAYLRLEAFDKAVDVLSTIVQQRPADHQAFLNLGTAWDVLDRPAEAEQAFREFLRLTAWSEARAGECNCSCGLPGQRALVRKWLEEHGSSS